MRFPTIRLALSLAVVPALLSAQTFKTDKFNIGGEGSTDYLNADPATGRLLQADGIFFRAGAAG